MMKSIGAELKNINPFLYNQSRSKHAPSKGIPPNHSEINLMPSENQDGGNPLSTNEVTSLMSNTNAGVTGLVGMPMRAPPMTAEHGQRRHYRPKSPNTQLVNMNISATVNSSQVFPAREAQSTDRFQPRLFSAHTAKQDSEQVIGVGQSHGQMRIKQHLNSESKRDAIYDVKSQDSRANIIVDNLVVPGGASALNDANRVLLGSKISHRILNQPSGAQLNISKSGFTHSYRKNVSKGTLVNQSNGSICYPQRIAGLELLQADARPTATRVQQELINYNGVFSAKTFEMIVPEDEQIIRMAQPRNPPQLMRHARQMSHKVSPRQIKNSAAASIMQAFGDQRPLKRNFTKGSSSIQELKNQAATVRQSQRQSQQLFQGHFGGSATPSTSSMNKFRVIQRLQRGTVFRDEDFEAKKPQPNAGFKLI